MVDAIANTETFHSTSEVEEPILMVTNPEQLT